MSTPAKPGRSRRSCGLRGSQRQNRFTDLPRNRRVIREADLLSITAIAQQLSSGEPKDSLLPRRRLLCAFASHAVTAALAQALRPASQPHRRTQDGEA
jgi:hypothetical protein